MRTCIIGLLVLLASYASADDKPKKLTKPERQALYDKARALSEKATGEYNSARYDAALRLLEESVALRRQIFPPDDFPNGHPALASALTNLAAAYKAVGQYERAFQHQQAALPMMRTFAPADMFPEGAENLFILLQSLADTLIYIGRLEQSLSYHDEALELAQRLMPKERFPDGHVRIEGARTARAFTLHLLGRSEDAVQQFDQSIATLRQLTAARMAHGVENLQYALNLSAGVRRDLGQLDQAVAQSEESLRLARQIYPVDRIPNGHPRIAVALHTMGMIMDAAGQHPRALALLEESLAMYRRLHPSDDYPNGVPEMAGLLQSQSLLLARMGQLDKAVDCGERALAIFRALFPRKEFPNGHIDLVRCLLSLGEMQTQIQKMDAGIAHLKEAVALSRRLATAGDGTSGSRELAYSLGNLANVFFRARQYEEALTAADEAKRLLEQFYSKPRFPEGHLDLALALNNRGVLYRQLQRTADARRDLRQALEMHQQLSERMIYGAGEASALRFLATLTPTRDSLLHTTMQLSDQSGADEYSHVWRSKAMVMRVLQERHQSARIAAAQSPKIAQQWSDLVRVRSAMNRALTSPPDDVAARDRLLGELALQRDALETALAQQLPDLALELSQSRRTPDDLTAALPKGNVFVDFIRAYQSDDRGVHHRPWYCAFVLAHGRPIQRVDLNDGETISKLAAAWRDQIASGQESAGADLRRRMWEPIAAKFPAGTTTVYIAPDGELNFIPWAALPGTKPNTVILEEFEVAVVPHAHFLLDQLQVPQVSKTAERMLALGNVNYNRTGGPEKAPRYSKLPGTAIEIRQLREIAAPRSLAVLEGDDATLARLQAQLPQSDYAHLATHGYFDEGKLSAERQRIEQFANAWRPGAGGQTSFTDHSARPPLAYIGLVLAGANHPTAVDPGVATGESIVNLALERLRLCVLSACETGLGEFAQGEGVFGLTRAFHVAGCPNVVASLWKVSDSATAALMAKFYHEMWVNKKPPIEALRIAQLTIYRSDSEQIAKLAGLRGKPDFTKTVELKVELRASASADAKRTPTKLWAAFVLSGVGR